MSNHDVSVKDDLESVLALVKSALQITMIDSTRDYPCELIEDAMIRLKRVSKNIKGTAKSFRKVALRAYKHEKGSNR